MIIELYQHIINIYKIYLNFLAREIFFLFCKVYKMSTKNTGLSYLKVFIPKKKIVYKDIILSTFLKKLFY